MQQLNNVVIIDVTKTNFAELWPKIIEDIASASFLAVDAEMSGLGIPKKTMTSDLNERYKTISSLAATRSIISLGLACFSCLDKSTNASDHSTASDNCQNEICYSVSVYNIILLCSDPYMVDPKAVEFLVDHGFNFNKQFAEGISFYAGNDRPNVNRPEISMRHLFSEIIRRRKPLVLHNGLADLIFMYQGFYAQCPSKLAAFTADLSEMFPSGIYDTKYIAEFLDHTPASFLLYIFKFNVRKNEDLCEQGKVSLKVSFKKQCEEAMVISLLEDKDIDISSNICERYAAYGWCIHGIHCKNSHNIDAILQFHQTKTSKKRKKKSKGPTNAAAKNPRLSISTISKTTNLNSQNDSTSKKRSVTQSDNDNESSIKTAVIACPLTEQEKMASPQNNSSQSDLNSDDHPQHDGSEIKVNGNDTANASNGINSNHCQVKGQNSIPNDGHRSGIDAFMTGYVFAVFIASRCKSVDTAPENCENFSSSIMHLSSKDQKSVINKLYLSGKNVPLPVCKSSFTKTSKHHNEKFIKVYLK